MDGNMDENPYKSPEGMSGQPPELTELNAQQPPATEPMSPFAYFCYVLGELLYGATFIFGIILILLGLFGGDPGMFRITFLIFGPLFLIGAVVKRKELRRAYGRS
jgi:hypothetical protein